MGFFSFIESFFFLSLGITFVLIFLMVFHFKQRVEQLEKKSENMLELCNGLVQQLHSLKTHCMSNPPAFFSRPPSDAKLSENITFSTSSPIPIPDLATTTGPFNKIVVPDFNDDDEIEVQDSEEEDIEVQDSEGEEEEEEEEEDEPIDVSLELETEELVFETTDEFRGDLSAIEEDVEELKEVELLAEIKEEEAKEVELLAELKEVDLLAEVVEELKEVELLAEVVEEAKEVELLAEVKEELKEEAKEELKEEAKEVEPEKSEKEGDDYKNMSVQQLRNQVLAKGLSTNPSKMKRPELIRLLQQGPPEKTLRDLALLI
jgi:hypothetical protein